MQQQEDAERAPGTGRHLRVVDVDGIETAHDRLGHTHDHEGDDGDDEAVRRDREHAARLLHAAQVHPGDDPDQHDRDGDAVRVRAGNAEYIAATPAETLTATVRM